MARALAGEHSHAAGFPLETSFCRPHRFCKLLPSAQLATIIGPGTGILSDHRRTLGFDFNIGECPPKSAPVAALSRLTFTPLASLVFRGGLFCALRWRSWHSSWMACPFSAVLLVSSSTGSQQMRQIGSRGLEVAEVTEGSVMLGKNWSPGANP
jgi:hypothetical protein